MQIRSNLFKFLKKIKIFTKTFAHKYLQKKAPRK